MKIFLFISSIIFILSCNKNDTTNNIPTPIPTTITTSFQGGITTITNTRRTSEVLGWTEYFDLTQFSKLEISWQTEAKTFPPQNNEIFTTVLNGNENGQTATNLVRDTLSKSVENFFATIEAFQITGKHSYRFFINTGSSTSYGDTTKNTIFVLSNLKVVGYTN